MKNKFLPHALLITSLVSVLAYKKVMKLDKCLFKECDQVMEFYND